MTSFVTENESTESIAEALGVVSDWNPGWCPKYFFTDLCEQEINAIETTFGGELINKQTNKLLPLPSPLARTIKVLIILHFTLR